MTAGGVWLSNMLGLQVPQRNLTWITHPKLELGAHHTLRLMQGGAIGGVTVFGPLAGVYASQNKLVLESISRVAFRCGALGIVLGMVGGPMVSFVQMRDKSFEEMKKSCYFLRNNSSELRRDRTSLAGATLGYAAARYLGRSATVTPLVVFGFCCGMLSADIYSVLIEDDSFPR